MSRQDEFVVVKVHRAKLDLSYMSLVESPGVSFRAQGGAPVKYFESGATLDATGRYRYALRRRWALHGDGVCWIMLNPSTADARQDDPTIRRCVGFSKAWGYGWLVVVNLFATRATDSKELRLRPDFYRSEHEALIGPENDDAITRAVAAAKLTVAAWGNHGALYNRGDEVREMLDAPLHHLGFTKQGQPRHPLYVRADAKPELWGALGAPREETSK